MFGIGIDVMTLEMASSTLIDWMDEPAAGCRYVVTPNVDHVVKLRSSPQFLVAYRDASMVLADGKPIVLASRLLRRSLRVTVTGSDLIPHLLASASRMQRPMRVFLLGAGPGIAQQAAEKIGRDWPNAHVVGVYSPPFGFEYDSVECDHIVGQINAAEPDLLVIGLGAPKQELWIHSNRDRLHAKVAICAGATIDFIAGSKARAPAWMRKLGLEWLHRVVTEPRRLLRRYAHDAVIFPAVLMREMIAGSSSAEEQV